MKAVIVLGRDENQVKHSPAIVKKFTKAKEEPSGTRREVQVEHQTDCPKQTRDKMVLLTTKFVQRFSLFVSFGGLVTAFVTTFLPLWKTMNSDLNEMENWYEGLWHMCIYTEEVGIHCKAFESFLSLPIDTLASRVLMCIAIASGILGVAAAFFGLRGVEIGSDREKMKRTLLILGGVFIIVSGIATLAAVSFMAYVMVVKFWDENLPDVMPRWEYGEGMFSAWFAGLLLVVGGSFLFVAVCMSDHEAKLQSKVVARNHKLPPRTLHYRKTEVI
ncbi:hypothetical protein DNTS_035290 [Danionella cerebrum]|uniref:Uncharacterized protein n=1 Tax=Danionella cerebrum TaxID=2873325 RepID=A0A553QBZ9_9TELE|nr:hypothetical protein DNTS_035290 [Danionella translucida]